MRLSSATKNCLLLTEHLHAQGKHEPRECVHAEDLVGSASWCTKPPTLSPRPRSECCTFPEGVSFACLSLRSQLTACVTRKHRLCQ